MPKHRTTLYLDHEVVLIAKARGINLSETCETVLRSMVGEIDPEKRMKELSDELTALQTAAQERTTGPLALELKALRDKYKARGRTSIGMTENWIRGNIKDYPRIRARFTVEELMDLLLEG